METLSLHVYKAIIMHRSFILFTAISALFLTGCGTRDANTPATFDEVISSRRSVRSYDASKTVSESEVREVLAAALEAPSWTNCEPSKYYVAMTPEKRDAAAKLVGERNEKSIKGAPVLIISTFEKGKSGFVRGEQRNEIGEGWGAYDNGLSNAYLILKARAMGFDTLIMGGRDSDALRGLFGIPENEEVMAVIALGYRAADPDRPQRRSLDDVARFY